VPGVRTNSATSQINTARHSYGQTTNLGGSASLTHSTTQFLFFQIRLITIVSLQPMHRAISALSSEKHLPQTYYLKFRAQGTIQAAYCPFISVSTGICINFHSNNCFGNTDFPSDSQVEYGYSGNLWFAHPLLFSTLNPHHTQSLFLVLLKHKLYFPSKIQNP